MQGGTGGRRQDEETRMERWCRVRKGEVGWSRCRIRVKGERNG